MTADVSVIVPVYNSAASIQECAHSIIDQAREHFGVELWLIDDGSTDGSADLVDELADAHEHVHAFHQANSGWAGSPRNRGIERATGRYLFFVDADDALLPGSLAEMVAFADAHGSDVLVPRIRPEGTRKIHEDVFASTLVDAPIELLVRSNHPFKLVNREFAEGAGLRFPEEKVRLEDAIYSFAAYAAARRVSILAEREYYVLRYREDAGNISTSPISPPNHVIGVRRSIEALDSGPWPEGRRRAAQEEFFARVVLSRYSRRFGKRKTDNKLQWVASNARVADLVEGSTLSQKDRAKLFGLRGADVQAMLALAQHKGGPLALAALDGAVATARGITLTGTVHPALDFEEVEAVALEFTHPKGAAILSMPADTSPLGHDPLLRTYGARFTATLGIRELLDLPECYMYAVVTAPDGRVTRTRVFTPVTRVVRHPAMRLLVGSTRFGGVTLRRVLAAPRLRAVAAPLARRARDRKSVV